MLVKGTVLADRESYALLYSLDELSLIVEMRGTYLSLKVIQLPNNRYML